LGKMKAECECVHACCHAWRKCYGTEVTHAAVESANPRCLYSVSRSC